MAPPRRPWFRFYVETFSDEEIRKLTPAERWAWAAVLGLARKSPVAGALLDKAGEPITDDVIADFAKVKPAEVKSMVARMVKLGSLHREAGTLVVVKWDTRQFESDDVAARVAKHRSSNALGNDDVTPNGGVDETVSPSVVLPEVQSSTEVDKSSSSEPLSRPTGSEEEDPRLSECWRLLAKADAEAFIAKGGTIRSKTWFTSAAENRQAIYGEQAVKLLGEHPDLTGAELADRILAGQGLSKDAMIANIERHERHRRGEFDCSTCEDRGIYEDEAGEVHECECKWRKSA